MTQFAGEIDMLLTRYTMATLIYFTSGGVVIHHLMSFTLCLGSALLPLYAGEQSRPAPEFVIQKTNGEQLLLSHFRGQVVALEFLDTTCRHCQECSLILNRLYKEYRTKGFQPIGVAFNQMASLLVPDYIRQLQLDFAVGVARRQEVLSFLQFPTGQRMYVPQLVFIDRKGMIRAYYPGGHDFYKNEEANMRALIEKLLKAPASAARGNAAGVNSRTSVQRRPSAELVGRPSESRDRLAGRTVAGRN